MAEWISVADRLPKEDGRYLCLYCLFPGKDNSPWHKILWFTNKAEENFDLAYNGEKGAAWYANDPEWGSTKIDNITHWMPLPEPPKVDFEDVVDLEKQTKDNSAAMRRVIDFVTGGK